MTEPLPATPSVKTAAKSDEEPIVATVVLAFSADPVVRWLYRDPQQYLANGPDFIRAFGGKAFKCGTAYFTEGYSGAALWLPPGVQPDEDAMVALMQRDLTASAQEAAFGVLEQMDAYHPDEPYWYLPLIGVDPALQGRGIGSALLKHMLALCDRDKTPAYLESSNQLNVSLYERHGFEAVGTIQVGEMPPIWPMVRKPR